MTCMMFLHYLPGRRARVFYEPRVATKCDICEGDDCGTVCVGEPGNHKDGSGGSAERSSSLNHFLLSVLLFFITFSKYFY